MKPFDPFTFPDNAGQARRDTKRLLSFNPEKGQIEIIETDNLQRFKLNTATNEYENVERQEPGEQNASWVTPTVADIIALEMGRQHFATVTSISEFARRQEPTAPLSSASHCPPRPEKAPSWLSQVRRRISGFIEEIFRQDEDSL